MSPWSRTQLENIQSRKHHGFLSLGAGIRKRKSVSNDMAFGIDTPTLPEPPNKRRSAPTPQELLDDIPGPWFEGRPARRAEKPAYGPTLAEMLGDPCSSDKEGMRVGRTSFRMLPAPLSASTSRSVEPAEEMTADAKHHDEAHIRRVKRNQRRQQRLREAGWQQNGPELPDEFSRDVQHVMNEISTDRQDPTRALVFQSMIAEACRREEPFAPPIRVFPHLSEGAPEFNFVYTSRIVYPPDTFKLQSSGCSCQGGRCKPDSSCSCYLRQAAENARYDEPPGFAYDERGLLRFRDDQAMAIWECNDMCGCGPECQNRKVGNGRAVPYDLVRTNQCGWGVRLGPLKNPKAGKKGKVKAGTFMGIYSGELLRIKEARRREKLYAQINLSYLFDLDFASLGKNEHLKTFEEEGFCFLSSTDMYNRDIATAGDASAPKDFHPHQTGALHVQPLTEPRTKEEMDEFNEYKTFWSVDAYHYGNISRFFNHNCQPNCMLRCCYVNEGDPTKPLLGIFAIKTIYSGDEITLSYTGQLNLEGRTEWDLDGPEETKRAIKEAKAYRKHLDRLGERNCWCSAPRCTGNMFLTEPESDDEADEAATNA